MGRGDARELRLYVCAGSDCRKALQEDPRLLDVARALDPELRRVRCQKICDGPVVGVAGPDGTLEWYARIRKRRALDALVDLCRDGRERKPLAKRRVMKRSGKLRRKK